jgi:hypothetical protein
MAEKEVLISKINSSLWWHVSPRDPEAYNKRGKFFASSYAQAEFYGRPNDKPEKVKIQNPIYGFSELEILKKLFDPKVATLLSLKDDIVGDDPKWYEKRIALDRKMFLAAKKKGCDAIVLLIPNGKKELSKNRKPSSIELNLL